jgi:hypothetical protein
MEIIVFLLLPLLVEICIVILISSLYFDLPILIALFLGISISSVGTSIILPF